MKAILFYLVLGALVAATVVNCSAVRTRANTMRVARVRRIDDAVGE